MLKKISNIPFAGTPEQEARLKAIMAECAGDRSMLMHVMQEAQNIYGYLPLEVQKMIAEGMEVPLEKVYGVATFYAQFSLEPKGKYEIIEKTSSKQTQIKWVNDILIENKKVCGILCEGVFNGTDSFIIVGIGINATPPQNGFRDEIKAIAGTVFDSAATNDCEKLTAMVIDNVLTQCENIEKCNFLATYRNKNIVLGKKVDILKQGEVIDNGTALEIDDQCHLKVELKNGEVVTLSSGEVSVKI